MATEAEIAWAGGIFEGEGCISWSLSPERCVGKQVPQARLSVAMTDEDTVRRFAAIIGLGAVALRKKHRSWQPHFKDSWQWEVRSWEDVTTVLGMLLPWLGARRSERAQEVLERGHRARQLMCETCGSAFTAGRADSRYCGQKCKYLARRIQHGLPTSRVKRRACSFCGCAYDGQAGGRKVSYCSRRCRYYARRQRDGYVLPEGVI